MTEWADVNGVSLRYELSGSGPRTLVCLHEMSGTLETWDAVMGSLRDVRVLRYDARGAGLSQKIKAVTFDELIEDLRMLLDALGITGPVSLAGIAVSAAVAAGFAARYPARVDRLLLMSLASGIAPDRREATEATVQELLSGGMRSRVDQRLDANFPAVLRDDPARVTAFRGRALSNDPVSFAAWYRMLLTLDLTAVFAAINCPTLVLGGEFDGTRPPAQVARDAQSIRGAVFEAVPSGHVMPALTPALVADRIRKFLIEREE